MIRKISVFCGSASGLREEYKTAAVNLGRLLVKNNIALVYGGGRVGLMGEIARTVLNAGGQVTGVIPRALAEKEVAFKELSDLRIVGSMHERKALIAGLADAFIALPGGFGTLDEIFEAITWAQLGIHQKPCAFMNVGGYYDHLFTFIGHAIEQRFIQENQKSLILIDEDPDRLLKKISAYRPLQVNKAQWALQAMES
jgi:uncharacterized protein (TIGR00730 family)